MFSNSWLCCNKYYVDEKKVKVISRFKFIYLLCNMKYHRKYKIIFGAHFLNRTDQLYYQVIIDTGKKGISRLVIYINHKISKFYGFQLSTMAMTLIMRFISQFLPHCNLLNFFYIDYLTKGLMRYLIVLVQGDLETKYRS